MRPIPRRSVLVAMLSVASVANAIALAAMPGQVGGSAAARTAGPGAVGVSGGMLTVSAATGAKDNLQITRPSLSRIRVTDFPSGTYTGSAIRAGARCVQAGSNRVSCFAAGVKRIAVSSGDLPDKVVNSTGLPSSIDGGPANDLLIGGRARDTLIGGRGPDALQGMDGNDLLSARDGAPDAPLDCDGGAQPGSADVAELDDPPDDPDSVVKGCETVVRPGLPGKYVALGDSISNGYVSQSQPRTTGFVGRLYSDYRSSLGVDELLDEARDGESSSTMRTGGQLSRGLADINAATDTRAVTIEIGGSEALFGGQCPGHWDEPGVCDVRANLAYIYGQLASALRRDPGTESFITMDYYNPYAGTGNEAAGDRVLWGSNRKAGCSDTGANVGLNDLIDQEAGKLGIPVANPYPAFKEHGQAYMSASDSLHVHPNSAGYVAIAQAFRQPGHPCG